MLVTAESGHKRKSGSPRRIRRAVRIGALTTFERIDWSHPSHIPRTTPDYARSDIAGRLPEPGRRSLGRCRSRNQHGERLNGSFFVEHVENPPPLPAAELEDGFRSFCESMEIAKC